MVPINYAGNTHPEKMHKGASVATGSRQPRGNLFTPKVRPEQSALYPKQPVP